MPEITAYCNRKGISLVPHGGRTGLSGGGVSAPGAIILQTTRMNRILSIDPLAGTVIVETGIVLEALLEAEVAKHNLSVGIDLGARGTATIGGMVSTNAGGIEAFRNGMTRHRVLGLEVVLPDGQILDDLKTVTKANEGYDIKQLFIGAEGTLGVVTKVSLSLVPKEGRTATALVSCLGVRQSRQDFQTLQKSSRRNVTLCRTHVAGLQPNHCGGIRSRVCAGLRDRSASAFSDSRGG